MKQTIIVIMTS